MRVSHMGAGPPTGKRKRPGAAHPPLPVPPRRGCAVPAGRL